MATRARAAPAASPSLARRIAPLAMVIEWLAIRLVVGALSVAVVISLGHLTVHLLAAAYAGITPYTPAASG